MTQWKTVWSAKPKIFTLRPFTELVTPGVDGGWTDGRKEGAINQLLSPGEMLGERGSHASPLL